MADPLTIVKGGLMIADFAKSFFAKKKVVVTTPSGAVVHAKDANNMPVREFSLKRTITTIVTALASAGVAYGVYTGVIDAETAAHLFDAINAAGEAANNIPVETTNP